MLRDAEGNAGLYRRGGVPALGGKRTAGPAPRAGAASGLRGPVPAGRPSKTDGVVALRAGTAERLSAIDPQWHTSGRYGLMQFKP